MEGKTDNNPPKKITYIEPENVIRKNTVTSSINYLLENSNKKYFLHSCSSIPWDDIEKLKQFKGRCYLPNCPHEINGIPIPIPLKYDIALNQAVHLLKYFILLIAHLLNYQQKGIMILV